MATSCPPRARASSRTNSGSAVAPDQQQSGGSGQVGGDQLGGLDEGEADLDDELGQDGNQRDDGEDEAPREDRLPGVRRPREHEGRADQAHPEADQRDLHRNHRARLVDHHPDDRAHRGREQVSPASRSAGPALCGPRSSGLLDAGRDRRLARRAVPPSDDGEREGPRRGRRPREAGGVRGAGEAPGARLVATGLRSVRRADRQSLAREGEGGRPADRHGVGNPDQSHGRWCHAPRGATSMRRVLCFTWPCCPRARITSTAAPGSSGVHADRRRGPYRRSNCRVNMMPARVEILTDSVIAFRTSKTMRSGRSTSASRGGSMSRSRWRGAEHLQGGAVGHRPSRPGPSP